MEKSEILTLKFFAILIHLTVQYITLMSSENKEKSKDLNDQKEGIQMICCQEL